MARGSMVRLSEPAYERLGTESRRFQYELNKRIPMSTLILAALTVALKHPTELIAELEK